LAGLVGDPDDFLASAWEQHHVLTRQPARADAFRRLLGTDDLLRLIAEHGLRAPGFRLVRDGATVARADYLRSAGVGTAKVHDLANVGRIAHEVRDGASVVGQALQRFWPPLTSFCAALSDELGHPVQANAYLSPAGSSGFDLHYDTHDVFVLQVEGQKDWAVHAPGDELPLRQRGTDLADRQYGDLVWEGTLGPGDCLYLPRGFGHQARAGDQASLHLTIGVLAYTWRTVLQRLADLLPEDDVLLRQALPVRGLDDDDVWEQAWKGFTQHLAEAVEQVDAGLVRAGLQQSLWSTQAVPDAADELRRSLTPLVVEPFTRLILHRGVVRRRATGDDGELLVLADREVRLPPAAGPLLDVVLAGGVVTAAGGLGGVDEGSTLVVFRRLVHEGVLQAASR